MSRNSKPTASVMSHDPLEGLGEEAAGERPRGAEGVELGDSLTIGDVALMLERLRQAADLGGTLMLRGGEVERVDAAGVQLLCAVLKAARSHDLEVRWDGASEVLSQAAKRLGLAGEAGL